MVKNVVICVAALLVIVMVSGCVEVGWNSKAHFAFGTPKIKLTDKFVLESSALRSEEVVNYAKSTTIPEKAPVAPVKTTSIPVYNPNKTTKNPKFASFRRYQND